jgi:hypothetical protein
VEGAAFARALDGFAVVFFGMSFFLMRSVVHSRLQREVDAIAGGNDLVLNQAAERRQLGDGVVYQ